MSRTEARLSRSLLRLLVARYLEVEPWRMPLDRRCFTCGGPHGKPRLSPPAGLEFSVSHSSDLLVLAFASAPVGVDVEALASQPEPPPPELVDLALAPDERRLLREAPVEDRARVFLSYWTAKEAVLKLLGQGLALPLPEVGVPPPGRAGRVDFAGAVAGETEAWVRPLDLGPAYVGALATSREVAHPRIAEVPLAIVPEISPSVPGPGSSVWPDARARP